MGHLPVSSAIFGRPTVHHKLATASSLGLETGRCKRPTLITFDHGINIRQHVGSSWWGVTPSGRSEPQDSVEMGMKADEVILQPVQLDVAQWKQVNLRLLVSIAEERRLTAIGSELIIECSSGSVSQSRIPFLRGSQYIVEPSTRATAACQPRH